MATTTLGGGACGARSIGVVVARGVHTFPIAITLFINFSLSIGPHGRIKRAAANGNAFVALPFLQHFSAAIIY